MIQLMFAGVPYEVLIVFFSGLGRPPLGTGVLIHCQGQERVGRPYGAGRGKELGEATLAALGSPGSSDLPSGFSLGPPGTASKPIKPQPNRLPQTTDVY